MKYLSKFTREYTAFQGWRLALKRKGETYVRYFSALELGGMQQAEAEARKMRDALLKDLENAPDAAAEIFERYRKKRPELPQGLRAPQGGKPAKAPRSCTLHCNYETAQLLNETARQWGIDHPSLLRAALYLLIAWSRTRKAPSLGTQPLIDYLTAQGTAAKLPPFAQLFTAPPKE